MGGFCGNWFSTGEIIFSCIEVNCWAGDGVRERGEEVERQGENGSFEFCSEYPKGSDLMAVLGGAMGAGIAGAIFTSLEVDWGVHNSTDVG